jgi:SsrA-binding protein
MGGKRAGKRNQGAESEEIVSVCRNRKASYEYTLSDQNECGMVLVGSEVKSLRENPPSMDQAFARIESGEAWLYGLDIPEYVKANQLNHKPKRKRKLLLHKDEISKLATKTAQKGCTLIPLEIYFKKGKAKIILAVGIGKKLHDKRESIKKSEANREIHREISRRRRRA